jgi:hypothetical protein
MFTCIICGFAGQELDDVAVPRADGRTCICLGCYGRATDTARPMPKALRRQIQAVLAEIDPVAQPQPGHTAHSI